jgi:hypothetical protein
MVLDSCIETYCEPLGSINGGEFLDQLRNYQFVKKDCAALSYALKQVVWYVTWRLPGGDSLVFDVVLTDSSLSSGLVSYSVSFHLLQVREFVSSDHCTIVLFILRVAQIMIGG